MNIARFLADTLNLLPRPGASDQPVCVVSRKVDGQWRQIRQYNRLPRLGPREKASDFPAVTDTPLTAA